jgi:repressor of nif and glnA expression
MKYVKILEGTGVTREQAEAHVLMISEILEDDLATKQDIKNLDVKFESIEHKILQSEYRMTIKLGSIVTIAIAAATAAIKLI